MRDNTVEFRRNLPHRLLRHAPISDKIVREGARSLSLQLHGDEYTLFTYGRACGLARIRRVLGSKLERCPSRSLHQGEEARLRSGSPAGARERRHLALCINNQVRGVQEGGLLGITFNWTMFVSHRIQGEQDSLQYDTWSTTPQCFSRQYIRTMDSETY